MSVVARDRLDSPIGAAPLPLRPTRLISGVIDGLLAVAAYLTAYWLRFEGDRLDIFLPNAWATMPWVVGLQLAALVAVRAYAKWPRVSWLVRVVTGIVLGTAAAGAVLATTRGFEGVSRMAFVSDAILMSVGAVGWRGAWVLRARARRSAAMERPGDELVDRAEEMATLGAVVGSLYQYRELLKNLVIKDLKLKYRGSAFGFLWSMLNPLLMIAVYTVAFTYILRVSTKGFVFYLMLGQLSWSFFAASASMSTGTIVDNGGLLKSVFFPRAILPIGTVLFNFAQYLLTVLVFLPLMMIWYRVPPSGSMLLFPVFLGLQVLFTIGVSMLLAAVTVFLRDVRHLIEVALAVLFWTTPIVYELRQVPEGLRPLILLSPVSPFIVAYQKLFFYREWPEPTLWLVAVTYALGMFVIGAMIVLAFDDRFTENL